MYIVEVRMLSTTTSSSDDKSLGEASVATAVGDFR